MSFSILLGLLGGLALFLYGMQMMSSGLEAAAGDKMKSILEKLTANRFLGVLVGALITAVIQSSSATTVMVVGFVNSRLMTLKQSIGVIMGANIGTTVTAWILSLGGISSDNMVMKLIGHRLNNHRGNAIIRKALIDICPVRCISQVKV